MLANLKLKYKMLSGPVLAAIGSVAILAIVVGSARTSGRNLELIETGYNPSLDMSRTLEGTLAEVQRSLQDAVAAGDEVGIEAAQALADDFRVRLAAELGNPVITPEEIDALGDEFDLYFGIAERTSAQMIDGTGGSTLTQPPGDDCGVLVTS